MPWPDDFAFSPSFSVPLILRHCCILDAIARTKNQHAALGLLCLLDALAGIYCFSSTGWSILHCFLHVVRIRISCWKDLALAVLFFPTTLCSHASRRVRCGRTMLHSDCLFFPFLPQGVSRGWVILKERALSCHPSSLMSQTVSPLGCVGFRHCAHFGKFAGLYRVCSSLFLSWTRFGD